MPYAEAFNLYSNPNAITPTSRKKMSRRHPGESSIDPSKKRARIEDPSTPLPSKETTPPPAPIDPTPPAPIDLTPPAPRNPSPPAQPGKTHVEAILTACTSANDRLKKLSKHWRSQEAFSNVSSMKVEQIISRSLNEGVLTMSTSWRRLEEMLPSMLKRLRLSRKDSASNSRWPRLNRLSNLPREELKQHKKALVKVIEAKERYKEASVLNFKEASKLQDELAISMKETAKWEE
ncbi:uncharacterized protein LOC133799819 [Humulus lupulus]|uniref:uncharacterized protein LOC133799819 n=1 Tax=Humulus lupulus TaxID=3486 RepID=UPI002B400D37|nr:uncharacterized protein LOC133799819 [Humulus lupulus]